MSNFANQHQFSIISFDRSSPIPLHRQLYEHIREGILRGQLKADARLPPTRQLAKQLAISRNTVTNAYKQLIAEGYLESSRGAHTRVTHTLPESMLHVEKTAVSTNKKPSKPDQDALHLSVHGQSFLRQPYPYWDRTGARPFSSSQPGVDAFPHPLWEKMLISSWRSISKDDLCYPSPLGYRPLRETLARYIQASRGVRCNAEQVIITNGTQQALSLITTLLLNPGDAVWVEDPSYNGIKLALNLRQAVTVPIPVDTQGLRVSEGIRLAKNGRMAYITPSHQYPLGVTMSLTRRLELLQWAAEQNAWIIEDDYDSEIRYKGYPLEALQGLDQSGRVIYLGTFSKVLFPSLRVGFMVVPQPLVEPLRAARAYIDRGNAVLEQMAIQRFIEEGHLGRHLRRMRTLYEQRQRVFVEMVHDFLAPTVEVFPSEAGLHLVGWLPEGVNDEHVSAHLMQGGIYAPPLSYFSLAPVPRGGLVLGYATISEEEIVTAVKKMRHLMRQIL